VLHTCNIENTINSDEQQNYKLYPLFREESVLNTYSKTPILSLRGNHLKMA